MIEPVGARTTTQLQEIYERMSQHAERGPGEVPPGDRQRFEAALGSVSEPQGQARVASVEEMQVAQLQATDPWVIAPPLGGAESGHAVPTVGERILDGLTNLREGVHSLHGQMQAVRDDPEITPGELLDLQMQLSQTSIMVQLTAAEVSTVSQKIDGLLKTG